MTIEVKVPALPESVADATVATWHKKAGDKISRDENLVDIETDKVMLEVPAPEAGILREIVKSSGSTVTSNEVLAIIDTAAVEETAEKPTQEKPAKAEKTAPEEQPKESPAPSKEAGHALSPSVRRAVEAHDVDVAQVKGTGKGGRVTKQDVDSYLKEPQVAALQGERPEQRVAMTRLRKRIAERLIESQKGTATLTTFNEVDLKPIMDIRKKYQDQFVKKHDVKLGFMSFFVKASIEALKRFPIVNASIDGDDVIYHGYFDIGVAVSTERGLVVPVLRDADQMSLADIEKQIIIFGQKARDGQLSLEEITGGTFTISNGGIFGSMLSTPILNPPQSAILGMHNIQERAVVVNKEIVIRPMMYLALSYDHRIIDGKDSVTFLKTIKELLEDPTRLLLDV